VTVIVVLGATVVVAVKLCVEVADVVSWGVEDAVLVEPVDVVVPAVMVVVEVALLVEGEAIV
jgi:hypothetical protein